MYALNATQIYYLTHELQPLLPFRIEKLYVPNYNQLAIIIYKRGQKQMMFVEVCSSYSRLTFLSPEVRPNQPSDPFSFQHQLRNYLSGMMITAVRQINNDRVIEIKCETHSKTSYLMLELMGHTGNIFLLDETFTIISMLMPHRDPVRCMGINTDYLLPEPSNHPLNINRTYFGDHKFLTFLEQELEPNIKIDQEDQYRKNYLTKEKQKLKKALKKEQNRLNDLKKLERYAHFQRMGELLKTNIHQMKRGMTEITVPNYYDPNYNTLTIPLDPKLNGIENMKRYFKRFDKYKRGFPILQEEIRKLQIEINDRKEVITIIELGGPIPEQFERGVTAITKRKKKQERVPYKAYVNDKGFQILVGRGSVDNDQLTFRVAGGNDLWFHVYQYSGSHVVIRLRHKKDKIDLNTILQAAHLAIRYSKASRTDSVEVCYTQRKYVKKPPKSKPGAVIFSQEKRLYLEYDPEIVAQLQLQE